MYRDDFDGPSTQDEDDEPNRAPVANPGAPPGTFVPLDTPAPATLPVPAPPVYTTPGQPAAAPAAPAPAQAGQWAATNQGFLDWANKTYGEDAVRGNSFVNAKAGGGFEKMLADYAAVSGNKAQFLGGPSGDRADFGQGVQDALTSDGMVWNAAGGRGPSVAAGGNGRYQTLMAGDGGGATFGGGGSASGSSTTKRGSDELFELLMKRAKQSQTIDPNDPTIRKQADTFNASTTREGRRYLSEMAERKGPGGNIGAEARMMAEKNSQAGAEHEGALMQHAQDNRKAEIEHALTTGAQFMTQQQQMQLQEELSRIDDATKRYQIGVQNDQFGRNLNQQNGQFMNDLGQRAYQFDTDDEFRRSPYAPQLQH